MPPVDLTHLNDSQREQVEKLLIEECESFSRNKDDIGDVPSVQMEIKLNDQRPVQKRYNTIHRPLYPEVKAHIQDLLNKNFISKSTSAYSSPIVAVRKKNGELRLCCDFRELNLRTIPDKHPLPKVQDALDALHGKKFFSLLDQGSAYHQAYIHQNSKHMTAFCTPWGLFQWNRIPFGLMNAPAQFQRMMETCLQGLHDEIVILYLDDLLIFSTSFEDHLEHLSKVLRRLRQHGIKLRPEKCDILKQEVKYLGFIVTPEGYKVDPDNVKAVTKLIDTPPTRVGDLRKILGFLGYFRRFVENFAKIARPLYVLLEKDKERMNEVKSIKKNNQLSSLCKVEWTALHQAALEKLVSAITSDPILVYPDFNLPFVVHTDASKEGLGAVLYQKRDEILRVVGYASRSLVAAERNYHSSKLEFLALKWALCEKFKPYVFYATNTLVVTDNNPLTYVTTTAKLTATGQRWINELAEYRFSIQYRSGKTHIDADFLSRYPLPINEYIKYCDTVVSPNEIDAIVCGIKCHPIIATKICPIQTDLGTHSVKIDLVKEQAEDQTIKAVCEMVKQNERPKTKELKQYPDEVTDLLRNWSKLVIDRKGLLCRMNRGRRQVILPKALKSIVYDELHSKMGHLGAERVCDLARERFFWPHMAKDIEDFIANKCRCLIQKKPHTEKTAPMGRITSSSPLEIVSIDFVHLETSSGGYQYILTIVDNFTRFLQGYATKNKSALTAAKILYNEYIPRFGIPEKILHDRGTEFNNKLFSDLNRLCGVNQLRTTPYHPMGNGQCERMNGTILSMLKTLEESQKSRWKDQLTKLTHAYNCTKNSSTGFSPFYLMFGRQPRLPIDAILGISEETSTSFVNHWQTAMKEAYDIANQNSETRKEKDQLRRNAKNLSCSLEPNDRVLLRNLSERGGPGKLRAHWESNISQQEIFN